MDEARPVAAFTQDVQHAVQVAGDAGATLGREAGGFIQHDDLVVALAATGATLGFDAIGGGKLAAQILAAMEQVASKNAARLFPEDPA